MTKAKRTGGMAQAVECLHSKNEALSSILNTTKNKNNLKNTLKGRLDFWVLLRNLILLF
jgi:hypothetical protein